MKAGSYPLAVVEWIDAYTDLSEVPAPSQRYVRWAAGWLIAKTAESVQIAQIWDPDTGPDTVLTIPRALVRRISASKGGCPAR